MLETLRQYLPALNDLTVPAIVAVIYWLIKRAGSPLIRSLTKLLRFSRYRDLSLAKRYRVDPFSIQRQIAKEEALFCAFIVCTVVSLILLLTINTGTSVYGRFLLHMVPVVALEVWWLWQKEFVSVLLEEASRIGPGFKRVVPARRQSDSRMKHREERRASLVRTLKSSKRIGRRLV
ncbi:hypothetical protein [Stutzerimonas nitrititolerans]|uniref:hypothetical protein n=1 Tax=Stutzerimonas nitrititolerans TaxID=2482751 RepID=UPI0028A10483|nr:hypothetical protein [Stutzerimonas nitrititolerans]